MSNQNCNQPGILLLDQNAHIQFADPSIEYRRGFAPAETYLKNPNQLWGGNMKKQFYAKFWNTIKSQHITSVELTNRHGNGDLQQEHLTILRLPVKNCHFYFELQPPANNHDSFQRVAQSLNEVPHLSFKDIEILFKELLLIDIGKSTSNDELIDFFIKQSETLFADRIVDSSIFQEQTTDHEKLFRYYERYHQTIFHYFTSRVSREDAEDLTHEVFLSAWSQFNSYQPRASYKTYLVRIAHNRYIDWLRQNKRQLDNIELKVEHGARSSIRTARNIDLSLLTDQLGPKEKELIVKYYLEGYKLREIANLWGMTENAIKLRISRARKKMRSLL